MDAEVDQGEESGQGPEAVGLSFDCERCGAKVLFEPGSQALRCSHCGHESKVASDGARVREYSFEEARGRVRHAPIEAIVGAGHEVGCDTCGARLVVQGQATRCPYCDSPKVVDIAHDDTLIVPESLLPFGVARDQALAAFRGWLQSRWFAPSDLKHRAREDAIDGVYVPYWTYDSQARARYVGRRGVHYWVSESYTDSQGRRQTRRVRRTRWYPAAGQVEVGFDDVLVCASKALPHELINQLEPWDLAALVSYRAEYLSGFLAERYQVDLDAGFKLAEQRMLPGIRSAISRDIGGDEQVILTVDVEHRGVMFKHLLLPLWISAFRYRDRVFRFFINGRTGEVRGERPYSWLKIAAAVIAGVAVLGSLAYLLRDV